MAKRRLPKWCSMGAFLGFVGHTGNQRSERERLPGACPAHDFCAKYPNFSPSFYPPLEKPPKQTRINPKPFPTEHTT